MKVTEDACRATHARYNRCQMRGTVLKPHAPSDDASTVTWLAIRLGSVVGVNILPSITVR